MDRVTFGVLPAQTLSSQLGFQLGLKDGIGCRKGVVVLRSGFHSTEKAQRQEGANVSGRAMLGEEQELELGQAFGFFNIKDVRFSHAAVWTQADT